MNTRSAATAALFSVGLIVSAEAGDVRYNFTSEFNARAGVAADGRTEGIATSDFSATETAATTAQAYHAPGSSPGTAVRVTFHLTPRTRIYRRGGWSRQWFPHAGSHRRGN